MATLLGMNATLVGVIVPLAAAVGGWAALLVLTLVASMALARSRSEARSASRVARTRQMGLIAERDELGRRVDDAETSLAETRGRLAAAESSLVAASERQRQAEDRAEQTGHQLAELRQQAEEADKAVGEAREQARRAGASAKAPPRITQSADSSSASSAGDLHGWAAAAVQLEHMRQARELAVLSGPSLGSEPQSSTPSESTIASLLEALGRELEAIREQVGTTGRAEPAGEPTSVLPKEVALLAMSAGAELLRRLASSCEEMVVSVQHPSEGTLGMEVRADGLRSLPIATRTVEELDLALAPVGGSCSLTMGEEDAAVTALELHWAAPQERRETPRSKGRAGAGQSRPPSAPRR